MKGMALELIAKLFIGIVAMLVVISLITFYSEQIKEFFNKIAHPNDDSGAEIISSNNFTTSQLKTFVMACWDKYGKKYQSKICYVLAGSVRSVDYDALKNSLDPPASVDITKFDNSKNATVIKAMTKGVIVEST